MPAISAPLPQFFDADGSALSGGYIYIGTAGSNPETAPLAVYWDSALTQPAVQPLRTVGGMIARAGTPTMAYIAASSYSMTVRNSRLEVAVHQSYVTAAGGSGAASTVDPGYGGMWPDVTPAASILRQRDRLFVGGGAAFTGNRFGAQSGFVTDATAGANWAPRDSSLFVASDRGLMQVTGFVSNANIDMTGGQPTESIGVSGFAIGNKAGRSVWGLYSDIQFEAGNYGYGLEIAAKNKGADLTSTPYLPTTGVYGIWLAGGGDTAYGGAGANPSNTAIAIGRTSGAPHAWNKGLVFFHDGLTRNSGYSTAIEMAEKHRIIWRTALNTIGLDIRSEVSAAASEVAIVAGNNSVTVAGSGGAVIGQFAHQSGAVNYWQILNSAAGASLQLVAAGADADIDLRLSPKGAGAVRFGTHTGTADTAISGYITIKDSAGTVRKLAVIS